MQEHEEENSVDKNPSPKSVDPGHKYESTHENPAQKALPAEKNPQTAKKWDFANWLKYKYGKLRKSRYDFIFETVEKFFKGAFSGFILGSIATFLEKSNVDFLNTLYEQFGKDFLHHYVGFPVGLLYVILILAAFLMAVSRKAAKVLRIILMDPITEFIFHMSAIAVGSLIAGNLFGHIPEGLFFSLWKLIGFLTVVCISVPTMVEYAYRAPEDISKTAENPMATPEEKANLKKKRDWQEWAVLGVAVVTGIVGFWFLQQVN